MFNFKKRIIISKATNYVTIIFHDPLMYRYTSSIYQSKILIIIICSRHTPASVHRWGVGVSPAFPLLPDGVNGGIYLYTVICIIYLNPLHVVSAIALIPTTLYPSMSQNQEMIECWRWLSVLYFFVRTDSFSFLFIITTPSDFHIITWRWFEIWYRAYTDTLINDAGSYTSLYQKYFICSIQIKFSNKTLKSIFCEIHFVLMEILDSICPFRYSTRLIKQYLEYL